MGVKINKKALMCYTKFCITHNGINFKRTITLISFKNTLAMALHTVSISNDQTFNLFPIYIKLTISLQSGYSLKI